MNHGWEKKKIEELCVPKKGILRASVKYKAEDIIEYVDISSIDRNSHQISHTSNYIFKDAPSRAQQVIVRNDILLSLVRPNLKNIACVSLDNSNLIASSGFCVLRSFGTLPRFLLYVITNDCFTDKLVAKCAGAAYPAVREEDVRSILIPVPPMEAQTQIVSELDKINELIGVKRSQLKDLDALAQSLFYETFGEPIDNPKGWETEKFGNICELSAGGDKPADTQKEMNAERNIPVYSNGIDNEGLYGYTSEPRITKPSLTISGRGTLGVPFIRKTPYVPIIRLIVAIPTSVVNLSFLYYLVKIMKFGGKGAAIPQLTVPMVKDVVLPVPPLALQEQFASRIEAIEEQKRRVEASIADLETLLASRMDYWFND